MSRTLSSTIAVVASLCLFSSANAGLINILEDNTTAYAQVTYDPGVVTDPGTTLMTFSGPLFPSAVFGGFSLSGDRTATLSLGDGYFDATSFSARNYANIFRGYYRFVVSLGTSVGSLHGATGSASAETDLNLRFQVTDGSSLIDLYAAYEGNAPVSLSLFDETLGVSVESLAPTSWSQESAQGVALAENHIYSLTGSLYAYTPLSGDPSSNFGFRFHDDLVLASVVEPDAITLLLLGLIGLAWTSRSRRVYPTA
ncbi:MAG: hypothetical protein P8171_26255 [Candidatus Thiodiazotropha sp.]